MWAEPPEVSKTKILQTNLGRCRAAHDIADAVAAEKEIDLVIISEPNVNLVRKGKLLSDNRTDVAISVKNRNVGISKVEKGEGFVKVLFEDWLLVGCYISPNVSIQIFKDFIDSVMTQLRDHRGEAILAGDLNAKSVLWGSPYSDARGDYISEWAAELNLVICNTGKTPTFERGTSSSFIDVTGATAKIAKKIRGWEVLRGEVLTYHNHIIFEVDLGTSFISKPKHKQVFFDRDKYLTKIREERENAKIDTLEDLMSVINKASKESTRIIKGNKRKMPFWWNESIENQRRLCCWFRRKIFRLKKRRNTDSAKQKEEWEKINEEYKISRKALKKLISQSKREHWGKMVDELESDVWGTGYQVVVKRLGMHTLPFNLTLKQKKEIIHWLFPQNEDTWRRGENIHEDILPFTIAELNEAADQIKIGKAPGPDSIPPEAIKIAVYELSEPFLKVLNNLLICQEFPKQWKTATVTLIWKGKQMESPSAFRPICMLNVAGKFFEILIKMRLQEEIDAKGGLSNRQFGFRKGHSTIQAVNEIIEAGNSTTSKWFVLIALDIKNAFNSATWSKIITQLQKRGISQYLINLIESYFTERVIQITRSEKMEVTAGVPQGSVLGPLLWNILYDPVLELNLTQGATSIAYADDLAVIVEAEDKDELEYRVNESLWEISEWMERNDLTLAAEKTEAIILKGPRKRDNLNLRVLGKTINPSKTVNYLGIILAEKMLFGEHIKRTIEKAEAKMAALTRILPNVGGPSSAKRVLLSGVIHSTILYGAPVWKDVLRIKKYDTMMSGIQRKALLRIASGYRTVSAAAIQVITGIPPIGLIVNERCRLFNRVDAHREATRNEERRATVIKWREIWGEHTETASWTKKIIPDIMPWIDCGHRRLDYYLTQFLSGHGFFKHYLYRMKLVNDENCQYCGGIDTAEHTVIQCDRWVFWRNELENQLGTQVTVENLVQLMVRSKRNWEQVAAFIRKVLKRKKVEEGEQTAT